mgnify:FL=1
MKEKIEIRSPLSGDTLIICQAIGKEVHRDYTIEYHTTVTCDNNTSEVVGILKSGTKISTRTFFKHKIGDIVVVHTYVYELIHTSFFVSHPSALELDLTQPVTLEQLKLPSVQLADGYKYVPQTFSPRAMAEQDSDFPKL